MSEKKYKPPRPPAPKVNPKKNSKKGKSSSTDSISFHFNPRALENDDDDELFGINISTKKDTDKNPEVKKPVSLNINRENGPKKNEVKDEMVTGGWVSVPKKIEHETTPPTLSSSSSSQISSPSNSIHKGTLNGDDPLHLMAGDDDDRFFESMFSSESKPVPSKDRKRSEGSLKQKKGGTGIFKVSAEVLEEKKTDFLDFPVDSPDGFIDPLSFLDRYVAEGFHEDASKKEEEKKELGTSKNVEKNGGNSLDSQEEERKRDSKNEDTDGELDINPYYYNIPTPAELPDEPVKPKHSKVSMSLSGLLKDQKEDHSTKESSSSLIESEQSSVASEKSVDIEVDKKPSKGAKEPKEIVAMSSSSSEVEESKPSSPVQGSKSEPSAPLPEAPVFTLSIFTLILFAYFVYPLPSYLTGFLTGVLFTFYICLFLIWWNLPPSEKKFDESLINESDPLDAPGPRMSAKKVLEKEQKPLMHRGWMNELLSGEYDPESYHISHTQSVYIRLENHTLRLSSPKANIQRRAMFDEPIHKPEFIHQRIYDIRGSRVFLLPDGLVKKRLWSKKYPICIELPKVGKSIKKKEIKVPFQDEVCNDLGFEVIKEEECLDKILVLFARTGREKEEWFWKFELATKFEKLKGKRPIPTLWKEVELKENKYYNKNGDLHHVRTDCFDPLSMKGMVDYYTFIAKVLPKEKDYRESAPPPMNVKAGGVTYAIPQPKDKKSAEEVALSLDPPLAWVNALLGRGFWDFLREKQWAEVVQTKLQKKLDKLKIPSFIEELKITDTDLGLNSPLIRRISAPTINERGLWVNLDISYAGSCCITLVTKFNPWKLGKNWKVDREMDEFIPSRTPSSTDKSGSNSDKHVAGTKNSNKPPKLRKRASSSAALDSEEEDSAESSDDEGDTLINTVSTVSDTVFGKGPQADIEGAQPKSSGKLMRLVNRVANSNYFQKATQNKYVKRAFDEVSNTPVELTVEVKELRGILAINVPPPPTDRLWYGFINKPHMWLSAKPKLGARRVSITHITEYIEKKLELEFQKIFVMPNMDDVLIPIMLFDLDENRL